MYNNLPEKLLLPELEKDILKYWAEKKIFEKSISQKDPNKYFTFYEGPPTANGMPGIHHVISRAVKDTVCRYKTMQGYQVHRKAGWDTHGLPVEVEVEKKLGIKSRSEIFEYGPERFNLACKESIFTYLEQWEFLTERMGYWINLKDAYVTFHNEYIESVWWALKQFFERGYMYKGFKIQPFCPICESPLSTHEVAQGYKELRDPSIYIKFKCTDNRYDGYDFLVWTTTPWTLPSNVALAVNPSEYYVKIKTEKGLNLILAEKRLGVIKEKYDILGKIIGSELENITYEPLFKFFEFEQKAYYVTLGDFVTMEDGTGIVHIAPAFGEDDYNIGLKYKLPLLQAVEKDGRFKKGCSSYEGKNFKEADPEIIDDLKKSDRLYKKEIYEHQYPHCWRHKVPLMYYACDTWFIETTRYKDKMIEKNKEINWNPPEYGIGRFGNWLEENKDWALSRNRFWGTPLPIWYSVDKNGKEHYECIGSIDELKQKAINWDEVYNENFLDLHKPYIDAIKIKSKDGEVMQRVEEVIDCWFDSGSMPFAQFHYPFENVDYFNDNYPADFIAEGVDQTRGWFYSLHAIGTFLFDKPAYKNLIVNGHVLDKDRKKMSKSAGNVVDPFLMMEKYGADLLRWYLVAGSPVWKPKSFNEEDLINLKNYFFDTLINTYRFFAIYSEIAGFQYNNSGKIKLNQRPEIDRWIISKLNSTKKTYLEKMDSYDITSAADTLEDFTVNHLSNWYVRRNRKRFRNNIADLDTLSAFQTLYECLYELCMMIAPIAPFLVEKIFLELNPNADSIHLEEFTPADFTTINTELEEKMALAQKIVYIVRALRVKNNLKVRQPLRQILIPALDKRFKEQLQSIKDIILDEINVKELKIIEGDSEIINKKAKPNFRSIGPKFGKDVKKVQQLITGMTNSQITEIEKNGKLNLEGFEIQREDIEVFTENIEGWIIETQDYITVALDTHLDEELRNEGITREFINRIQNYRKNNNFKVEDLVEIFVDTNSQIINALQKNLNYIKEEVNSKEIIFSKLDNGYFETDINGEPCKFIINKVN